ncbi:MAG: hypothetical protein ABI239_05000 [Aquihabitans sp.]
MRTALACRLLDQILEQAVAIDIAVAVIRPPARDGRSHLEVDVLVAPKHRVAFERLLLEHGLRHRQAWGRRPHRFYVAPVADPAGELPIDWLKVDLVTDLAFGPLHELRSGTAVRCLAARSEEDRRSARLSPADELLALLLHVTLDRASIRDRDLTRMVDMATLVDEPGAMATPKLTGPLGERWWPALIAAARRGDCDQLQLLADQARGVMVYGHRVEVAWRRETSKVLRHSTKVLTAVCGRGSLVAFVGPDGTGKTTLTQALGNTAGMPARVLYGGTYPSTTRQSSLPGLTTARVITRLLHTRVQVTWHRARGRLVILDRHPLQARPTTADRQLTTRARLRRHVIAVTLPAPDLLVTLDAPTAVLHQRRPEHSVEQLDEDRRRHRAFVGRTIGSPSLQADRPAGSIRDDAIVLIWTQALPGRPPRKLVDS